LRTLRYFLQYGLGLILLLTGLGKLLDVPGFIRVIAEYRISPLWLLPFIAVIVVLAELRVAEMLIRGRDLARAAVASAILHSLFLTVAAVTLIRGIEIDNCGCFGVFLARPLGVQTVFEDLVLAGASVGLYLLVNRNRAA
jgi:hypothetical protein